MESIKVLLADDEITVRTFVRTVIAKEKLPVAALLETDNGIEAIRMARELGPELIFLDIRMPGCNGLQAAEAILAGNPQANIVIVSAYDEFEYARQAFRAGVIDYLLKPVKPADLAAIISRVAAAAGQTGSSPGGVPAAAGKPALLAAVENYVQANLEKPLRLKDIAKAVFVSPCHLSRTFKQLAGQSIMDFVQEQRLAKAEELLATTGLTVTEVASRVGFNDAAYFATCFKKKRNMSPLRYRKAQQASKQQPISILGGQGQ